MSHTVFQKKLINLVSLSDTIVLGRPCRQTISSKKRVATFFAFVVLEYGIKCAILENLCTTTKIKSTFCVVFGKPRKKSILKSYQGSCRTGSGWYNPVFFFWLFASWHALHSSQILATSSIFRRGQNKWSSTIATVSSCPKCPLQPPPCNSHGTCSRMDVDGKHNWFPRKR